MRIALLGSAPSSLGLAPIGQPGWQTWGCSPGVYYQCGSPDAWFELHRWEPPVIGSPGQQRQWFSPEYVAWMGMRHPAKCTVWMREPVAEVPASKALPVDELSRKYGTFFWTSSLAWMMAMAIDAILEERAAFETANPGTTCPIQSEIGLYGVDMSATEEYGYQRAGLQHFLLMAADLGIEITVPPESDLLRPMPFYGIDESEHWAIKMTARRKEHEQRIAYFNVQMEQVTHDKAFIEGALDELNYHMQTWGGDRRAMGPDPRIIAQMPKVQEEVQARQPPKPREEKP